MKSKRMLAMSSLNKSIFKTYSNSITLANNHHQELVLQKSASNASTVVKSAALDGAEEVRLDLHKDGTCETIQARMVATMPRGLFRWTSRMTTSKWRTQ